MKTAKFWKGIVAIVLLAAMMMAMNGVAVMAQGTGEPVESDVGMWYHPLYAKVDSIEPVWLTGFGMDSANSFIGDVNGDGVDDAVVFLPDGKWWVALSNTNRFDTPALWGTGHGAGSAYQMLADVNGDGKMDAIVVFSTGDIYVSLSTGTAFAGYSQWAAGFCPGANSYLMGDVNGDGKMDAVAFLNSGTWHAALSNGTIFGAPSQWITGLGAGSSNQLLGDVNGDGKWDAVAFTQVGGSWQVAQSTGSSFLTPYQWIAGHGYGSGEQILIDANGNNHVDGYADAFAIFDGDPNGDGDSGDWYMAKNNREGAYFAPGVMNSGFGSGSTRQFAGNVTGNENGWKASVAFYKDTGTWKVQPYRFYKQNIYNTWDAWEINYRPMTQGVYGTYDSGNAAVIDEHLAMLADAQVDFILLDQTNNIYIDEGYIWNNSLKVAERIAIWNANPANRKIRYAVAIGGIQWSANATTIVFEAGEVYNTFVNSNLGGDNYYKLNGKPLLVNMSNKGVWDQYAGKSVVEDQFSLRWANAYGTSQAGEYGWVKYDDGGIPAFSPEVMSIYAGWNNHVGYPVVWRNGGQHYASEWNTVLAQAVRPRIVMINSFNEVGENTVLQPSDTGRLDAARQDEKWTDMSGRPAPSLYWDMTKTYIRALKGTYQASDAFWGIQGAAGWFYQQKDGNIYSDMGWNTQIDIWQGAQDYCQVKQAGQHPGEYDSVRKWTAPVAGSVHISGSIAKEAPHGDGVYASVLHNGTTVWGPTLITSISPTNVGVDIGLHAGDDISFIINCNGDCAYDYTLWNTTVQYTE